ncbi:MAG: hypothetical protein UH625_05325 [Muribaculaceae bacterium]|nr:hypothetical protein [Muribaculaceae bacterium]
MSDDEYNGDTVHDMWVDYTFHQYTGELDDWYGDSGNDGCSPPCYTSKYRPSKSTSQLIAECRNRINSYKANIADLEMEVERTRKSVDDPAVPPGKRKKMQKSLDVNFPNRLARYRQNIEKYEAQLTSLLMKREKARNRRTIGLCIFAILVSLLVFWLIY